MKKTLILLVALSSVALSGCAPGSRWTWNNYQEHLYDYYAQKLSDAEYVEFLLQAEKDSQNGNTKLAPGLYAEIGTLYLRMGQEKEAVGYYQKEAEAWPEAKPFMDALIKGLAQRNQKAGG